MEIQGNVDEIDPMPDLTNRVQILVESPADTGIKPRKHYHIQGSVCGLPYRSSA